MESIWSDLDYNLPLDQLGIQLNSKLEVLKSSVIEPSEKLIRQIITVLKYCLISTRSQEYDFRQLFSAYLRPILMIHRKCFIRKNNSGQIYENCFDQLTEFFTICFMELFYMNDYPVASEVIEIWATAILHVKPKTRENAYKSHSKQFEHMINYMARTGDYQFRVKMLNVLLRYFPTLDEDNITALENLFKKVLFTSAGNYLVNMAKSAQPDEKIIRAFLNGLNDATGNRIISIAAKSVTFGAYEICSVGSDIIWVDSNRATKTITFSFNEKMSTPSFSVGSHLCTIEKANINEVFQKDSRGSKDFGFVVNLNKSVALKMKGPGDEFELKGIEKVKIMFSNAEKHNAGFRRMYEVLREWTGASPRRLANYFEDKENNHSGQASTSGNHMGEPATSKVPRSTEKTQKIQKIPMALRRSQRLSTETRLEKLIHYSPPRKPSKPKKRDQKTAPAPPPLNKRRLLSKGGIMDLTTENKIEGPPAKKARFDNVEASTAKPLDEPTIEIEESGPVIDVSGPVIDKSSPVIKESGPVVVESGPAIVESGPVIDESGPVIDESSILIDESASDNNMSISQIPRKQLKETIKKNVASINSKNTMGNASGKPAAKRSQIKLIRFKIPLKCTIESEKPSAMTSKPRKKFIKRTAYDKTVVSLKKLPKGFLKTDRDAAVLNSLNLVARSGVEGDTAFGVQDHQDVEMMPIAEVANAGHLSDDSVKLVIDKTTASTQRRIPLQRVENIIEATVQNDHKQITRQHQKSDLSEAKDAGHHSNKMASSQSTEALPNVIPLTRSAPIEDIEPVDKGLFTTDVSPGPSYTLVDQPSEAFVLLMKSINKKYETPDEVEQSVQNLKMKEAGHQANDATPVETNEMAVPLSTLSPTKSVDDQMVQKESTHSPDQGTAEQIATNIQPGTEDAAFNQSKSTTYDELSETAGKNLEFIVRRLRKDVLAENEDGEDLEDVEDQSDDSIVNENGPSSSVTEEEAILLGDNTTSQQDPIFNEQAAQDNAIEISLPNIFDTVKVFRDSISTYTQRYLGNITQVCAEFTNNIAQICEDIAETAKASSASKDTV